MSSNLSAALATQQSIKVYVDDTMTGHDHDSDYYTQTQLGSTTGGTEGASLIGTDTKSNLNNATTLEVAMTELDTRASEWNTAYGWDDHSTQNYFDTDIDDLDDLSDGTTYQRVAATEVDASGYVTVLTEDVTQADAKYIATDKVQARDTDGLSLFEDGGEGIFVEDITGNVGIGTTTPDSLLEVTTTAHVGTDLTVDGNFAFDAGSTVDTILDQDDMSSNLSTALATQQSIKVYVDDTMTGHDHDSDYYT
ncbi:unnamed protein product, partial [marine sediment metagenome]